MFFFKELKRRNVFRAGIAYIVVAWLILQVVDVVLPNLGVPDWVFKIILLVLVIGFPVVLVIAYVFELTTEGFKRESEVEHKEGSESSGREWGFAIIAILAVTLGFFAYDKFVLSTAELGKSIAVLPFVNMSSNLEQEYFADGLSEELLNMLARIPKLRVIARTSSFSYKGKDAKIADIARELNVDHVLEGSVRSYGGTEVRITAQLIRTDDESHLWAKDYNVTLDDVFGVQDQIAAAVVEQLKVRLLGTMPATREIDSEAYRLYLLARELSRRSTPEGHVRSNKLYHQALDIEPGYAPAWAGLAESFIFFGERVLTDAIGKTLQDGRCADVSAVDDNYVAKVDDAFDEAMCAANKALEIDQFNASAHASLGRIAMVYGSSEGNLAIAAKHLERALKLEPSNPLIINQAATFSKNLGRLDKAIELYEYAAARDPISSGVHTNLALSYFAAGRYDDAIKKYDTALSLSPDANGVRSWLATTHVFNGDPDAALAALSNEPSEPWRLIGEVIAYHAAGQQAQLAPKLTLLVEKYGGEWAFNVAYVLASIGDADKAFAALETAVKNNDTGLSEIVVTPEFNNIRSDPRWLPFLESIGKAPPQLAAVAFNVALPEQP